ncbi:hypothetical protein [Leeuwenhoekiella sp. H156]|uniref:hypothetical protein n=1 Tax=Leeuwenhoekiella sp. H156 TaxID=3450128 RepID=UPI003FA459A1
MKYLLFFLLGISFLQAQVGIGTTAPRGALEVQSKTGGLLIPRMTSNERDNLTIAMRPTGTLLFNTDVTAIQMNSGTDVNPIWSNLAVTSSTINTSHLRIASASQTIPNISTPLAFQQLSFNNTQGFVTINGANSTFTLLANKTYKLEFDAKWVASGSGTFVRFRWYNTTTNSWLGTNQHIEYATSPYGIGGGGTAIAIISPTVNTNVQVRVYAPNNTNITVGDAANGTAYPTVTISILN